MHRARSGRAGLGLATSDGPGGTVVRRLLPTTVSVLVLLSVLRWMGEHGGLYGTLTGIILMSLASIAITTALLWHFARRLDLDECARRDAEQQLRASARHFELSRDLHCTASFDGHFQQLNAAWSETLGWSEDELRARPFVAFVHPDDRAQTERETACLAEGGITVGFVNRYAAKDGSWHWIDWQATASIEDALIYASARDVTDAKLGELALAASEGRLREIIHTAHDAFISMDDAGVITEWNPQAVQTFGYSREEALGRELAALIIPEDARVAHRRGLRRFLETGEHKVSGRRLELTALRRDGGLFPVELTISTLRTSSGYTFHAFLRDITESKRSQEDLALARDQAVAMSKMKSMFVANVSHEIRTPMNGVIGMTELLLDTPLDLEQREYVDTISSSGEALLSIIDDILDFSKIEAGKLELDPTDFSLRQTIERTCGMLAGRAQAKGLEFVVAIDAEVPALVHGDAARLAQVIGNFASNAIKFTAEGEVVVHASACPAGEGTTCVRVTVSDTGIGIERAALDELFKPFSQADGTTTRKYGGTGLGLAISRHLIELMGGHVGAESCPGTGSSFWFELLLARGDADVAAPEEERDMAGLRALVVDNDGAGRRVLQQLLTSWQMSCHVTADPDDALHTLESAAAAGSHFALAFLDVNTSDVDVYALSHEIRSRPALRDTRLVLLASFGARNDMPPGNEIDGMLTKPVRASRLYEEIQAVIAGDLFGAALRRRHPTVTPAAEDGAASPLVLVVEDTLVNQVVAEKMLARCGYRARVVDNGLDALDALDSEEFAAILMDCQMPKLDGYEATQEIRRREMGATRVPIIAMTANSMQGERERCLQAGMDHYLAKPLRKQQLHEALTQWAVVAPARPAGTPPLQPPVAVMEPSLLDETTIGELENLDHAMLSRLSALYFTQAEGQMAELDGAIDSREFSTVGEVAHKLKGSSRTLGATRVAEILADIEAAARGGDAGEAQELVVRLRCGLTDTQAALAGRLDRIPSPG